MAAWGVNGEANGAHLSTWGRTQGHGNTVKGIVDFVDNTGIPVYLNTDKSVGFEKRDDRQVPAAQISAASREMGKVTYNQENVGKALTNLKTTLSGSSNKYDLAKVKAELAKKGISLEALDRLGAQGLTGDALIEAALKEAGIDSKDCFSTSYNDKLAAFDEAGTELKTALAAYNANKNQTTLATLIKAKDNHEIARAAIGNPALDGDKKEVWAKTAEALSAAQTPTTTPARTAPAPVAAKQPAPPAGLNDNGRAIWLFVYNQTGGKVNLDIKATREIAKDGAIDADEAGKYGINMVVFDGVDNGMLDSTTRAAGATVGDRKLDAAELAHYNKVVEELAQRTGKTTKEIYAAYQTAKYLVNVDLREVSSRIDNLSALVKGGNIDFAKIKDGDTAEIERLKTLLGKDVHTDILKNIVEQIKAGRITSAEQLNKYFFNAMMGSLTGEFEFWGVADFGKLANIGRYAPRAGKSGDDLSTWLRTGKSPEAEGTSGAGQDGEGYRKAMTALQEKGKTYNDAVAVYSSGEHSAVLKGNPQAIEFVVDLAIKEGKYSDLIEFLKGQTLSAEQKSDIYRKIVEKQTQKIQDKLGASPPDLNGAKTELENLKTLVASMGTEGTGHQGQVYSITLTIAMQLAQRALGTDKQDAYALIEIIPEGAEFNHGRDQNAVTIHGRLEARFALAASIKDKEPMTNFLATLPAGTTATQRAYAHYYLAKAGETPREKKALESTLALYKKSAEAIKDDASPQADLLRTKLETEMGQLIDAYNRSHQTDSQHTLQGLRDKYINKMPRPGSPATSAPVGGGGGGGSADIP
ncbi:MAG: hypothetical protein WCW67_03970 [Candidatus Margulisiibacteriota bacterium]|jgi:hypothetical protein